MDNQQKIEKLLAEPALDKKTMERMEENASCSETGVNRRIMLASLTQSVVDLEEVRRTKPEVFAQIKISAENFLTHAESVHEIARVSVNRLEIADTQGKKLIAV